MDYSLDVIFTLLLLLGLSQLLPRRVAKNSEDLMDKHRHLALLSKYSAYRMGMYINYKE